MKTTITENEFKRRAAAVCAAGIVVCLFIVFLFSISPDSNKSLPSMEVKKISVSPYEIKSRYQDSIIARNDSILKQQEIEIAIMRRRLKDANK